MKLAYYPGCTQESTAKEFDESVREVCSILGIELEEIPDWSCCGASSGHNLDHLLSLALPARNLVLAQKLGMDVAVACPACYLRLRTAQHEISADGGLKQDVERAIGTGYDVGIRTKHILDILYHQVGMENIAHKVVKPLAGLKVVAYYGCYLVRPAKIVGFDDAENPQIMDELMKALGAEAIDWSYKVDCCGGSLALARSDIIENLVAKLVNAARQSGASVIVTACPMCQANIDTRQATVEGEKMPILYFSELMALAFGIEDKKIISWIKRHIVDPLPVLKSVNLM